MDLDSAAIAEWLEQGRTYEEIISPLRFIMLLSHSIAKDKGFWDEERNDGEMIALMHSELSEALEAVRKPELEQDEHCPEFLSVEIEFADLLIRIMDTCYARGWRLPKAIVAKMQYNANREHKHGKRF